MAAGVISRSWKRAPAGFDRDSSFLREYAGLLDRAGALSLRFLTVGGRPIAYLFEVERGGRSFLWHIAYDLEWQRVSPGQMILADAVREAHERRLASVEFLGSSDYLAQWVPEVRSFSCARVVNPSLLSRLRERIYVSVHGRRRAEAKAAVGDRREQEKRRHRGGCDG